MAWALKVGCARNGQAKHTYIHTYIHTYCPWSLVPMEPAFWSGGWMPHSQSIPTCEDIVEEAYLWEEDFPLWVWPSRSSIPKALQNRKSWVLMTSCWQSVGLNPWWKPKVTKFRTMFCSRTTRVEKNGKALSSKHMKHINIWYFFITNHVDNGDVLLVWCPMGDMIRDFMTKPLQGALFQKFRDQILGVVPAQDPGPRKAKTKQDRWVQYSHWQAYERQGTQT